MNTARNSYFSNTMWMLVERIMRITIGLALTVSIARFLGPLEFGKLSYAMSLVAIFESSNIGLDKLLAKNLIEDEASSDYIMGAGIALRLGGALFLVFLTTVLVGF